MADRFLTLPLADRRDVLEAAFGRGLAQSTALLEKDVWVVWTLQTLFAAPFADDLVFKGGTSLSKAYNIIQRFSEDVDLTYDVRKLADEQAGHPEDLTDAEAKSLGRRIREKLLPRLLEAEIQPYLEAQISAAGLQATIGREGENLFVVYEAAAEYPAHVYCLEGKLRGATGFARHWHDLVRLDKAGFAAAAMADRDLASAVADHKAKFFPAKDAHAAPVDYHAAVNGQLQLVPQGEARELLRADYEAMIEAGYLESDAEPFDALMVLCVDLQDRINATI